MSLKIPVDTAHSLASLLGHSTDSNVRTFASALEGEADAAAAAGEGEFDLDEPATETYQAARAALAADLNSRR